MLIPFGTDVVHKHKPHVTYFLIAANVLFFAVQWAAARNGGALSEHASVRELTNLFGSGQLSGPDFHLYSLISYQFIHASWWHVLGNMIFLLPFGKAVEDRMGHVGFAIFYITSGMCCGGSHALLSASPVIGASGSVCAVTAAFLVLAPKTNINVLFVFFLIAIIKIPSLLFVFFFVLFDLFGLLTSAAGVNSDQTAWVVHLGGYAFGFTIAFALLKLGLIQSTEFDLPTMIRQFNRRHQIKQVIQDAHKDLQQQDQELSADSLSRANIAHCVATGEIDEAIAAFNSERQADSKFHIDKISLLAIGNHLMNANRIHEGCEMFEIFLKRHPEVDESGDIALLLSAKYVRVLDKTDQAKKLLNKYKEHFSAKHQTLITALTKEMQ